MVASPLNRVRHVGLAHYRHRHWLRRRAVVWREVAAEDRWRRPDDVGHVAGNQAAANAAGLGAAERQVLQTIGGQGGQRFRGIAIPGVIGLRDAAVGVFEPVLS